MPGPESTFLLPRTSKALDPAQFGFIAQEIRRHDLSEKESLARTLHNNAMQKLSAAQLMLRPKLSKASHDRISTLTQEALSDLQSLEAGLYALAYSHIPITDTLRHRLGLRGVSLRIKNKEALDAKPQELFVDIIILAGQLGRFLATGSRDRAPRGIALGFRYGCFTLQASYGDLTPHTPLDDDALRLSLGRLALMGARYLVTPKRMLVIYAANTGQPSGRGTP